MLVSPRNRTQCVSSTSQTPLPSAGAVADANLATASTTTDDRIESTCQDNARASGGDVDFSSFRMNRSAHTIGLSNASGAEDKPRKTVTWSTITIHEFGVGLGGSAVSTKGGPSIGLSDEPEFTWTTKVGEMAECSEGVHRFSRSQRIRLLQDAGIPDGLITRHTREASVILGSRRRSQTAWEDDSESEESECDEEEEERDPMMPSRKRKIDQVTLERPGSLYLRRPRMIPINYV